MHESISSDMLYRQSKEGSCSPWHVTSTLLQYSGCARRRREGAGGSEIEGRGRRGTRARGGGGGVCGGGEGGTRGGGGGGARHPVARVDGLVVAADARGLHPHGLVAGRHAGAGRLGRRNDRLAEALGVVLVLVDRAEHGIAVDHAYGAHGHDAVLAVRRSFDRLSVFPDARVLGRPCNRSIAIVALLVAVAGLVHVGARVAYDAALIGVGLHPAVALRVAVRAHRRRRRVRRRRRRRLRRLHLGRRRAPRRRARQRARRRPRRRRRVRARRRRRRRRRRGRRRRRRRRRVVPVAAVVCVAEAGW